jgi:hypothetical protein
MDFAFISPLPYPSLDGICRSAMPSASFEFAFYGTSVEIDGSNYCTLQLFLAGESQPRSINNGTSGSPLLKAQGLPSGVLNRMRVDVRCPQSGSTILNYFALFDIEIDGWFSISDDFPKKTTIDDQDPAIKYTGNWTSDTKVLTTNYYNTSKHTSGSSSDTLSFLFTQEAVAIYGSVGPDHGQYRVQVDDYAPQTFNSSSTITGAPALMFFQGGLGLSKAHKATVTNLGPGIIEIDGIQLFAPYSYTPTASIGSPDATLPVPIPPPSSSSAHSSKSVAVIVGPIVGVVGALLVVGATLFFLKQRKSREKDVEGPLQHQETGTYTTTSGVTPTSWTSHNPSLYQPNPSPQPNLTSSSTGAYSSQPTLDPARAPLSPPPDYISQHPHTQMMSTAAWNQLGSAPQPMFLSSPESEPIHRVAPMTVVFPTPTHPQPPRSSVQDEKSQDQSAQS